MTRAQHKLFRHRSVWLVAGLLLLGPALAPGLLPPFERGQAAAQEKAPRVTDVGPAWGGVRVRYSAVRAGDQYFVGYYDAERWLTLAIVDPATKAVRRLRLPNQFRGFDSHNRVVVAVDKSGRVHVVGNVHASPLVYFKIDPPYTKATPSVMVGRDETRVTYPSFYTDPGGNLVFFYRAGGPGDGNWFLNRWTGQAWQRMSAVFGDEDANQRESVSAYPRLVQAPTGTVHAAILWRRGLKGATNYKITYARSADFVNWTDSRGKPIPLPITANNTETIVAPGEGSGLGRLNIGVDAADRPLVQFRKKSDREGGNAMFIARLAEGQWRAHEIDRDRDGRAGRLSFLDNPTWSAVFSAKPGGAIVACAGSEAITQSCQELDATTLATIGRVQPPERALREYAAPGSADAERPAVAVVAAMDQRLHHVGDAYLVWPTQNLRPKRARECRREVECPGASGELRLVIF